MRLPGIICVLKLHASVRLLLLLCVQKLKVNVRFLLGGLTSYDARGPHEL